MTCLSNAYNIFLAIEMLHPCSVVRTHEDVYMYGYK